MKADPAQTRTQALRSGAAALTGAGVAEPEADARILLCAALGVERSALVQAPDVPLGAAAASCFESHLRRRLGREPVWRILGRREFWSLEFEVTPAVLDPRSDTETLVAAGVRVLGRDRNRPWQILDLGTGSGVILCALLSELPSAFGWGIDISFEACAVARRNLRRHGLSGRSLVVQGRWASALRPGRFDLVVSNPPYIESAALAGLSPEVRDHDPALALDGGADGLSAYRAIAAYLPGILVPGGRALFEVGAGQAAAVGAVLRSAGLTAIETAEDLAGIERVVMAAAP